MRLYLAPMEGITGCYMRRRMNEHFGGIDVFMTPFLPASKNLNAKQRRDLDPANNPGMNLVPQLIGNVASEITEMTKKMEDMGYREVNINLGCPSGTVTSKKRGSGFLQEPEALDAFLEEVYDKSPLPVSIKTRIGFSSPEEWDRLIQIYAKYPISELVIHPRTRSEFYNGLPHREAFRQAIEVIGASIPLVYNGNLFTQADYESLQEDFPETDRFMMGRGLIARPDLARVLKGGNAATMEELRDYHDGLVADYRCIFQGDRDMIFHMKEVWSYLRESFTGSEKGWKMIKKANTLTEYQLAVQYIWKECEVSKR